jgi:hypothetical protein
MGSGAVVILLGHVLHPHGRGAVQALGDGDVGHGGGGRGAMPMNFVCGKPNRVTRSHLLVWGALPSDLSSARCDNQDLSGGVRMPSRPSSRFEGDETS